MSKWHICPTCSGEGSHSIALGVIDVNEWDSDELSDYFAGGYDSPCETCKGSGKVTAQQLEDYEPVRSYSTDQEYYWRREGGY